MLLFLIVKLIVVILFLFMFLRRPNLVWGVGLLTVTTAVLLDTFLGTFGRDEMVAQFGFFFYVISGALLGGAAVWIWGLLRPVTVPAETTHLTPPPLGRRAASHPPAPSVTDRAGTVFDRQMLYDEIHQRFGREDVLDLIFDLGINENDVMMLDQDMRQLIVNVMDLAEQQGQTGALALAVERILTPLPPENLPRLEKITASSPPTVLRQYLLAHYNLTQLAQMTAELGIDWEQLGAGSKKEKARSLLLYLYRRNRINELIDLMHNTSQMAVSAPQQTAG